MMTKKDYERAAAIVQIRHARVKRSWDGGDEESLTKELEKEALAVEDSFVTFFQGDNPLFNVERFRSACRMVNHNQKRGGK